MNNDLLSKTIPEIVQELTRRSRLKYTHVMNRMSDVMGFEYSINNFTRKFRRVNASARYGTDEMLALTRAFVDGCGEGERCHAIEAFRLFDLASIPIGDFSLLAPLFPEDEYDAAWDVYHYRRSPSTRPPVTPVRGQNRGISV